MKVSNVNGASESICRCGSWLDHWKNFSGQAVPTYCPESSCLNQDLLGAHVKRADARDDNWYIMPLCAEHGKATGTLVVNDAFELVPADVAETCGKKS
jgi:hypothetical protein